MYSDYSNPVTLKPKRKVWVTALIVAAIVLGAAGLSFLATMGTVRVNNEQAVKDELITQNTRLRLSIKDDAVSPEAVASVASTDDIAVRITITSDLKSYCLEAHSRKEDGQIRYHMYKDTPEVEPIQGLCGENTTKKPEAPTNVLLGSVSSSTASFMWEPAIDARSYEIECSLSANTGKAVTAKASSREGNITGLSSGGEYKCRVLAENSTGKSEWSEPITITTIAALQIPTNLKITVNSSTSLSYSWSPVAGATEYVLEYASNAAFTENVKKISTKNTNGTIDMLKPFTPYYFHVKVVMSGVSESQAPYSATIQSRTNQ